MSIHVGPKGKHVSVPEGWEVIKDGKCIKEDKFVNLQTFKFQYVDPDDIDLPVSAFEVLIRFIPPRMK